MDLRPRIAAEIVDALMDQTSWSESARASARERWIQIALSKIVSHSIEFPGGGWDISCGDPAVVEAYLSKYPKLRQVLADVLAKAEEVEPGVRVRVEVHSDPESCHVCWEGQSLNIYPEFRMDGSIHDPVFTAKREAMEDWWLDYPGRRGPNKDDEVGEVNVFPRWRQEDER